MALKQQKETWSSTGWPLHPRSSVIIMITGVSITTYNHYWCREGIVTISVNLRTPSFLYSASSPLAEGLHPDLSFSDALKVCHFYVFYKIPHFPLVSFEMEMNLILCLKRDAANEQDKQKLTDADNSVVTGGEGGGGPGVQHVVMQGALTLGGEPTMQHIDDGLL